MNTDALNAIAGFLTLTLLEITLGIDNILLLAVITDRLRVEQQNFARKLGLFLAMIQRILLLGLLSWITNLLAPLFHIKGYPVSGKMLILIGGGLFLTVKGALEIFEMVREGKKGPTPLKNGSTYLSLPVALIQITLLDIVFSLDSVITAVGMVEDLSIMIAAVITSVGVMMLAANSVSRFILENPRIKLLALAFLSMIGILLIGEGFGIHLPKGYIYFALGFSLALELLGTFAVPSIRSQTQPTQR